MFITLEGMDGSGKTTVLNRLKKDLEESGFEVILTREPGGIELCEKIRNLLLEKTEKKMEAWTEALLFIAARKEHLEKLIKPELNKNKIVISDRFLDSTSAYQGGARGLGIKKIQSLQEVVLDGFLPDLTLYFELSFEDAEKRISSRKEETNRLDEETKKFKNAVKASFDEIVKSNPDRIKPINASLPLDEVYNQVKGEVFKKIKSWIKNN